MAKILSKLTIVTDGIGGASQVILPAELSEYVMRTSPIAGC